MELEISKRQDLPGSSHRKDTSHTHTIGALWLLAQRDEPVVNLGNFTSQRRLQNEFLQREGECVESWGILSNRNSGHFHHASWETPPGPNGFEQPGLWLVHCPQGWSAPCTGPRGDTAFLRLLALNPALVPGMVSQHWACSPNLGTDSLMWTAPGDLLGPVSPSVSQC